MMCHFWRMPVPADAWNCLFLESHETKIEFDRNRATVTHRYLRGCCRSVVSGAKRVYSAGAGAAAFVAAWPGDDLSGQASRAACSGDCDSRDCFMRCRLRICLEAVCRVYGSGGSAAGLQNDAGAEDPCVERVAQHEFEQGVADGGRSGDGAGEEQFGAVEESRTKRLPAPGSSAARPMAVEVVPSSNPFASVGSVLGSWDRRGWW